LHLHLVVVGQRFRLHLIMLRVGLLGVQHVRSCPSISDLSACMRHRPRLAPHALYSPACPLQPRAQLASAQCTYQQASFFPGKFDTTTLKQTKHCGVPPPANKQTNNVPGGSEPDFT
jgi:hypothetical protein